MAFLNDIETIRAIDWAATYLWDVRLEGAPSPFDTFFPAMDVEETRGDVSSYDFQWHLSNFKVPKSSSSKHLRLSFADDSKGTLWKFFDTWINTTIFNDGKCVSTIATCTKRLTLLKLDRQRVITEEFRYNVYPEGSLNFTGNSDNGLRTYSVNFVVTGIERSNGSLL